jgi:hypothetical protein
MKIFGIGLQKTGTTSLGMSLLHLGYRHRTFTQAMVLCVSEGLLEPVFAFVDQFDSFDDLPWPLIYPRLDERYPGSKFILTTRRDSQTWLRSMKQHALVMGPKEHRKMAYGHVMPFGHEAEYVARYERHNREVREYFQDRPGDLLEVCWETGSGWKELCAFLDKPIPDIPFPHENKASDRRARRLRGTVKWILYASILRRQDWR